ncbi:hypothetical protein [Roseovarius aestuariivivens]|uniref:hypothetical protein n=1 Tax=Roseovarius aestuariivivens TaxID=1888910 RepID=UPI0010811E83|nr:hypothetical protein [Roseovarius aestuariivivens]
MIRRLLSACAFLGLSACSGLVPATLIEMARLDPFSADPAGFAVGIDTASGIAPAAGTAQLTFTATHSPRGDIRRFDARLIEQDAGPDRVIYRLAPGDVGALRAYQQEIAGWRDTSDGNSTLALTVSAEGCRTRATGLPEDPRISVFIRLTPEGRMRPLLRKAPALPFFEAQSPGDLPLCAGTR